MIDPRDAERARAVMGLPLGASPDQVRARHGELVKQWHPDRFANDPQGQAEATVRMRAINAAYALLSDLGAHPAHYQAEPQAGGTAQPGARLTQEQIDRMVASIGSTSAVDAVLKSPLVQWGRYSYLRKRPADLALLVALLVAVVGSGFYARHLRWGTLALGYALSLLTYFLAAGTGGRRRWLGWVLLLACIATTAWFVVLR